MSAREHVAWLLWCANEGYLTAEDRPARGNWLLEPVESLHVDDAAARPHWLAMADEVLAALSADGGGR
jgi:hypothetical protein